VLKYEYYSTLSQGNRIRTEPIPPSRGLILDRHGVVLADNRRRSRSSWCANRSATTKALDATLASAGRHRAAAPGGGQQHPAHRAAAQGVRERAHQAAADEEEMALFAVHRYQFSGVDIRTRLARHYPLKEIAVHAIGYVSAINEEDLKQIDSAEYAGTSLIGKLGVEAPMSSSCTASRASREILVNAAGRPVDKQGDYTPQLTIGRPSPATT
jgi:penicillin-binding protein 2